MPGRRAPPLLVLALLAACGGAAPTPASTPPATTASATTPAVTAAVTTARPATTASPDDGASPGESIPDAGLTAVRASATTAYVVRVAGGRTDLLATTDAGATVRRVTPPGPRADYTLTFLSATTGYARFGDAWLGPTRLRLTTDGARTWSVVRMPTTDAVIGVAGHGDRVFVLTTRCLDQTRCDRLRLWTGRPGGPLAQTRALPQRAGSSGYALAAWGDSVWLGLGLDDARPVVAWSTDAGRTLRLTAGFAGLACDPVASSAHVVWNPCRTGMLMAFTRWVDGREHPLPLEAAGTTGAFLQPVSDDVAWFGRAVGDDADRTPAGLFRTTDGGRHFTRLSAGPPGYGATTTVTFLDAQHGLAADGVTLRRTTDAGRTWQQVALPATAPS